MTILTVYPRLVVDGAAGAIDFYVAVFGAVEKDRHLDDDGRIVHSELAIGDARVAVRDEGYGDPAPGGLGGTPVILSMEVTDPDAVAAAMLSRGAVVVHPIADHPYGRGGRLKDPYGHQWMLSKP